MAPYLKVTSDEVAPLREHYRGVAHDVLAILWARKGIIGAFVVAGLIAAVAAVIALPPRFTSEAILQVNFSREEPNTATKVAKIASMDAGAVVESTVRILRSRALASAVVSRLGLGTDPEFTRPSTLMRVIWLGREAVGLPVIVPTAEDIAAERLSDRLQINVVPRSYVISIVVSAGDPQRAALLANATGLEYLRGQRLQHLLETQRNLERDVADVAAVFGPNHPRSIESKEKLQELRVRIATLKSSAVSAETVAAEGNEFLPAEPVMIPAGPRIPVAIAIFFAIAVFACGGLIAILELRAPTPHRGRTTTPAGNDKATPVVAAHSATQESSAARWLA